MAQVPTGTKLFVASAYAAPQTTTAVTNAAEAVVTCAGHGYSNGDILEFISGWGRLNKRLVRIKSVATDTFVIEGFDTTNTTFFPAGTGVGTVREVTSWTEIAQILSVSSSGGEPRNVTYKYLDSDVEYSINDGFSAQSMTIEMDADAISTAGWTALKLLTEVQTDTGMRITMRNGSVVYLPCTVALNEAPNFADGQINRCTLSVNGNNRVSRYSA